MNIPSINAIIDILEQKDTNLRKVSKSDIENATIFSQPSSREEKIKSYRKQGEYGAKKFIKP